MFLQNYQSVIIKNVWYIIIIAPAFCYKMEEQIRHQMWQNISLTIQFRKVDEMHFQVKVAGFSIWCHSWKCDKNYGHEAKKLRKSIQFVELNHWTTRLSVTKRPSQYFGYATMQMVWYHKDTNNSMLQQHFLWKDVACCDASVHGVVLSIAMSSNHKQYCCQLRKGH